MLTILGVGLVLRLPFASWVQHPGHSDYSFYYTVAENLVDGRGLQIDYIWHYLTKPETITHPSYDYWMPLTSVIISIFMYAFGKSLFVALLPSILFGLILGLVTYFWAKLYSTSEFVALSSAGLVTVVPYLFWESLLTDTAIYFAVFGSLALYFMVKGWSNPKGFLWAGVFGGLAHLTRQDGLMLAPVLATTILLSRYFWRRKLAYLFLSFALYGAIFSPVLIKNYTTFGSPFTPGVYKVMFLSDWEDAYSYAKEASLNSYLHLGLGAILRSKVYVARRNIDVFREFFGDLVLGFAIAGLCGAVFSEESRKKWRLYMPPVLLLGLLYFFHSFVFPMSGQGSFQTSSPATIPVFLVVSVDTMFRYIRSKAVAVGLIAAATLFLLHGSLIWARERLGGENMMIGRELSRLQSVLSEQSDFNKDTVIMTRHPWEVYVSTRCKAIQLPNDDLETIFAVAKKYHAKYLVLPAPRQALEQIYRGTQTDDRLTLVATLPDSQMFVKLYRINLPE